MLPHLLLQAWSMRRPCEYSPKPCLGGPAGWQPRAKPWTTQTAYDETKAMAQINTPFPHAERRDLTEPPIELILAQVRFPTLAELFGNEGYVAFATAIRSEYPRATPLHEIGIEFGQGGARQVASTPVWKFEDLGGEWTVTLTPEFLALELRRYQHFSEFRDRFDRLWLRLVELHKIENRTRLGLRYIDRFASDKPTKRPLPPDWFDLIQSSLFALRLLDTSLQPQAGQLVHSFAITDALALTYRSAFKWGTTDSPDFREAVLDLDCYDPLVAETSNVATRLDELKEISHNAFWWTFGKLLTKWDPPND